MRGAIYVSNSKNEKISGKSKVDSSYVSIKHSCPSTCMLRNAGCYGQGSFVGMINKKMESRGKGNSAIEMARQEAKAIDESYNGGKVPDGRPFRVHTVGDSRTVKGTRLINSAIARWKRRGGGIAWSFTHSWANVHRKNWSNVSILASITNAKDIAVARRQGYAPAIVVPTHKSDKAYTLRGSKIKFIPCPAQLKANINCVSCKLCFNADRLFDGGFGISFAAHGVKKNEIKRKLIIIQ